MLGIIGNKFSIGKETYHPFSAELHYYRIDKRHWSICFERIKKAGFRIISTAVPWNIHQDDKRFLDFNGMTDPRKDLIVFLELAREFGFKVILRPGPWVSGQLKNGGLPDYLFKDLKLFARDATGQELKLEEDFGADGGYLPSYLHSSYLFHVKNYFKSFIDVTKNYVHPRGPVFMVELDYETSFGGLTDPASADYNPDVLAEHYPQFLEARYEDIKKLNTLYKEKNSSFEKVQPPRSFEKLDQKHYCKVLDWFRFRQHMLNSYLEVMEDVFKSYTVEPLIFRSLHFQPGDILPSYNLVPEDRAPFLGANVFPKGTYFDLSVKARFLKAEYGFAYAASFTSGAAAVDPEREELVAPISPNTARFFLTAGLSSGFKGMNQYMFVDRDHWYGAPLRNDGTVSPSYSVARQFNTRIQEIGFEDMDTKPSIAVIANRLYSWLNLTSSKKMFTYMNKLLTESTTGFCRDLMRLKLNYGIRENRDWSTMAVYKLLFIPSSEIMAEKDQQAIVDLAKEGVAIVMCGVMPKFNENLKDCQIIAKHFRIKSTITDSIGTVTHKQGDFPAYVYAHLRTTDDSKVKTIIKEGAKPVGLCSSRYKGNFYFFSFDIASGGNHKKLNFLESILSGESQQPYLYCSDPSVDISFQMGEKNGLLLIVAPPPGELSSEYESGQRQVIVKADLKNAGMKSPNLKLTDLFGDEEATPLRTTNKELQNGIAIDLAFPDGIAYLVQKR
ncbi:MAG: beta-galactosidase [bacterium]|nr:beta-galactosidase [bacterium]